MKDPIVVGRIYQHFKGDVYLVTGISTDAETNMSIVEYTALYGRCERYSRFAIHFISFIDKNQDLIKDREDNRTGQDRCFELVGEDSRCVVQTKLSNGLIETLI